MRFNLWSDEKSEKLKQLWMSGKSASQCAEALGGLTRNAVIGRVHRMGLPHRDSPSDKKRAAHVARRTMKAKIEARKPRPWLQEKVAPKAWDHYEPHVPLPELIAVEPKNRRGVADVEPNQCRWPINDVLSEDFHFCDRQKHPGVSYCTHHARIAFAPPESIRRRPLEHVETDQKPAETVPNFATFMETV